MPILPLSPEPRGPQRYAHSARLRLACAGGLFLAALAGGCATRDRAVQFPESPIARIAQPDGELLAYDVSGDGRIDYAQVVQAGFKSRLLFPAAEGGTRWVEVDRSAPQRNRPLIVLLLDGVAYDRVRALYNAGRFRLLRPPTRVISTFPSLTDVAYDQFFGTGPTPGFEAGYFDRSANRETAGASVYLAGENERWIAAVDYRMSFLRDALMYLTPQSTYTAELNNARRVLDRRLRAGARQVVLYLLSTDGLGHMVSAEHMERRLTELDAWIERAAYDWRGEVEFVVLADHGNTTTPPTRFDIHRILRDAGLRVAKRLDRSGDVCVPLFGLLDMARIHTYDDATRDRVVQTLRGRPEVSVLAWREGDAAVLESTDGLARVTAGAGYRYRCEVIRGDPLQLSAVCAAGAERSADEWLQATRDSEHPAAPPRVWDAFFRVSTEKPDVIVSLSANAFVGSGFFSALTRMHGTHGGLSRQASEAFLMCGASDLPATLFLADTSDALRERFGWPPPPIVPKK